MTVIIRSITQGCAALALVAGGIALVALFVASENVLQEQVWATLAVAMFALAATLMIAVCASYLDELNRKR